MVYFPRSVFVIDLMLTICVIGGVRFGVRAYTESARVHLTHANTLIIGAGRAGSAIARELKINEKLEYNPVGFIDDDPSKKGLKLQGVKVLGTTDQLYRIIKENDVAHIFIAIPSATGKQIQRIIDECRACNVDFKTLPEYGDVINGSATVGHMRNVKVEDLLRRAPVRVELGRIREKLQSRVVLITGAGGSIGSELARQVAKFAPAKLVLFDQSENDLHKIDIELAESFPKLDYLPVVGDITNLDQVRQVMAEYRPQFVIHAAAYKHVPMMEKNSFQAITNNVFGTYNVAHAAREFEVRDFVLISSDKAVNPSNIMGVTKRVAELLILGLQHQKTHFVAVRFGNVLRSNGSVLPLFEEQIAQRRAVTITHPEARRYFMTIPEAVQLVLQAATMGKGGEIFVLDMGEPIRIVDLAVDLIRLSGLEPERDIRIVYTGLRPGEKLIEELRLEGEGIKETAHEKIRVLDGGQVSSRQVEVWIKELEARTNARDLGGLVGKLKEIVPEYSPSREILALAQESVQTQMASSMGAGSASIKWPRK
jgi:FlaA1/EpsC-like NDP-sugar epimerase